MYLDELVPIEEHILALAAERKLNVHVMTVLARVKKRQGRLDIAEQILEMATACEMDRALVISRINLSVVCQLLGDMRSAWAALDEAIDIDALHPLVKQRVESAGHLDTDGLGVN